MFFFLLCFICRIVHWRLHMHGATADMTNRRVWVMRARTARTRAQHTRLVETSYYPYRSMVHALYICDVCQWVPLANSARTDEVCMVRLAARCRRSNRPINFLDLRWLVLTHWASVAFSRQLATIERAHDTNVTSKTRHTRIAEEEFIAEKNTAT